MQPIHSVTAPPQTVKDILTEASQQLAASSDSARLDAELLLAHSLGKNRTWLHTWPEHPLDSKTSALFEQLLARRLQGEPIAHILEQREFWSLPFRVTKDTLIPRPETELMIETLLKHFPQTHHRLLDLGTGSGAIAIAMASEKPHWEITATDQSAAALTVARDNAQQLNCPQIAFLAGDWFAALADNSHFDIIASNPPYIADADPHLSQGDVRFEPLSALSSGTDGLDDIRTIVNDARDYLAENGYLIIEHGYDQKSAVKALFEAAGYEKVTQIHDLSGQPRLTAGFYNLKSDT